MQQSEALDILKMGHSVFLTGAAGSGKTFVLNEYIKFLKDNSIKHAVTASTGIAATHIGGMTIHSWSGMGIKDSLAEAEIEKLLERSYLNKRFKKTATLIIDEVSMLHPYQLDMIDQLCRAFKRNDEVFGGMQVVLCGDLFQLPPVSRTNGAPKFFTDSEIWKKMESKICYLGEQHRHEDAELTTILNDIRSDGVGDHTLEPLRGRYKARIDDDLIPTKLYTHNADVDRINAEALAVLDGDQRSYDMWSHGGVSLVETLKKSCLTSENLDLKVGATVMFVKNNFEKGYVNGTLGVIDGYEDDNGYPVVEAYDGKRIVASPESWVIEEDGKVKAEITQVPLRLAWAITVHKSQGMTLDAAEVDLSKSFTPGMGYVALSRVKALGGLRLMGLNGTALRVDEGVLENDGVMNAKSLEAIDHVTGLSKAEIKKMHDDFVEKHSIEDLHEEKVPTIDVTKKLLEEGKNLEQIADERKLKVESIVSHIEKLQERGDKLDLEAIRPDAVRLEVIKKAFEKAKDTHLAPARGILGKDYSYVEIRIGRLFVEK